MQIKDIISSVESLAPLNYAEDFDNVGLITGSPDREVTGVLVCLDALEEVVEEAVERSCNLILTFHPIIFKGLKKLSGSTYVEKAVVKAIKNDIAIFAIHTALDNQFKGVNHMIAKKLGLVNHVVDTQSELIEKCEAILEKIITQAPLAVGMVITCVNACYTHDENGYQTEANSFSSCCKSEDFIEGTTAFLEKRKPEFKGE